MKQKAVDPSEILINDDGTVNHMAYHAKPWLRFLGRMFDYSLFFLFLWAISWGKSENTLIPFEYFLWIPVESLFLWSLGTTPGKWLLGITLSQKKGKKLDFPTSLRRSFHVWFRGLGMGIPFINVVCMLVAFQRLKVLKTTTWDRDDHIHVAYQQIGKWRIVLAVLITLVSLGYYYSQKHG